MEFIKLTHENLDKEHICCAISSNKDPQVASKKAWRKERISEGLVFLKSAQRGKCFIEYIPAEYASRKVVVTVENTIIISPAIPRPDLIIICAMSYSPA